MSALDALMGECPQIVEVRDQLRRLADRFSASVRFPPILLCGETGTGKGLLARAIHSSSTRSRGPFVDIDCAAIPEALIESELFGHERGAFTDARQARIGLVEAADGGTLFIDEIGLLPVALQGKLLKTVEERAVRKLGGTRRTNIDVVIVAATNEDLAMATQERRFREDLYHRLAALTFVLPPLRERGEDIVLLARYFLCRACNEHRIAEKRLTRDACTALSAYRWPGNVRELANVIERAALLTDEHTITATHLTFLATTAKARSAGPNPHATRLRESMSGFEQAHLLEALREAQGNVSLAAERLGLPRNTLRYRIKRLGLSYTAAPRRQRQTSARSVYDPPSQSLDWERRMLELTHAQIAPSAALQFPQHGPRIEILQKANLFTGMVALGAGRYVYDSKGSWPAAPIKVGVVTDLTGPIGWGGIPNANVARLIVDDINSMGGLLGRPLQMILEDTASNERLAIDKVRDLVVRHKVDVVFGGITSSMRNSIKDAIVRHGKTLYIYPQLYEGGESTPYLFCSGPTPAQQCDAFIPWLIKNGGKRFFLPSADYVWPRVLNAYARRSIEKSGGEIVGEEYFPIDQSDYSALVNRIMKNKVDVIFNTIIPPGVAPFFAQLYRAGFSKAGGRLACVFYDENALNVTPANEIEGLSSCLDYFQTLGDSYGDKLQERYTSLYGTRHPFTAGTAATGMYRGLRLWAAAVTEARTVEREAVAAALDHAKIVDGPGGGCEMVPGMRHVKMNMYTAVAQGGRYAVVDRSNGRAMPGTA